MKDISEGQIQKRFTQSSRSHLSIGMVEPLEHRGHREHLGGLSVVSVPSSRPSKKLMNNPDKCRLPTAFRLPPTS